MQAITGKVAVITGSSSGIGKTLALEMAQRGARVVLNGRNESRLAATEQFLREQGHDVMAVAGDVSNFEDCRRLVERTMEAHGRIDILVNNAGLAAEGDIERTHPDLFRKIMEVNYLGAAYPTSLAIPHLRQSRGAVLFISSLAGIHGLPGYSLYSASKMSLTAMAESLKKELHGTGVHVGIAYVGFTENDPNKTFYKPDGALETLPKRETVKVEPVEKVARRLINMIERRTYKSTFSTLGKTLQVLNRLTPAVVEWVLTRNYRRQKQQSGND